MNLDLPGGGFFMPPFVKLCDGVKLDDALVEKVRVVMKKTYTARHIPDKIYQVDAVPHTLTGKKMEVPVRRILIKHWSTPSAMHANSTIIGCNCDRQ